MHQYIVVLSIMHDVTRLNILDKKYALDFCYKHDGKPP